MFLQFFTSLREAQVPVTLREYLTLMEALDADLADQSVENFYYLSRAALVKDERNLDKFDRVFGTVFKGLESLLDAHGEGGHPGRMAEEARRKIPHRGREEADRGDGLGQAHGDASQAPGGAEGPPPGRQQVDRHGRHLAVRRLRLQSRGRADRAGEEPQQPRRQGLGPPRVQGSRRQCRARHPQHQDRAAPPAQIRPHRRAGRARSRHHDQGDRQPRLSRRAHAPRTAQRGQGSGVLRHRRLDGFACRAGRGAVLGREERIQAHGIFLLPQLPL